MIYEKGKRRALVLDADTAKSAASDIIVKETDDLSWIHRLPLGDHFVTKMNDSGMIDSLITAGDSLTVNRQDDAEVGNIVVAIYDDQLLVRRLGIKNGNYYLLPDNECYIPVRKTEVRL